MFAASRFVHTFCAAFSLAIPRSRFVVVTGVSGSGKTLAFDLLFVECQRCFLDSRNVHARQFVEQLPRPDVDLITGIPPTVSIEQHNRRGGGKRPVATATEIYHCLRLLFARPGTQFRPERRQGRYAKALLKCWSFPGVANRDVAAPLRFAERVSQTRLWGA